MQQIKQPSSSILKPTALPRELGRISQPAGRWACFRFASFNTRALPASHQVIRCVMASSFRTISTFAARATARAVKSSTVGPRPPFMMMRSADFARRFNSLTSCSSSSPTVVFAVTIKPSFDSDCATRAELLSTVTPVISSLPVSNN